MNLTQLDQQFGLKGIAKIVAVMCGVLILFLFWSVSQGPSAKEKALKADLVQANAKITAQNEAAALYVKICKATNGDQAARMATDMYKLLKAANIEPAKFPLQTLACIEEARSRQRALTVKAVAHSKTNIGRSAHKRSARARRRPRSG